jgi:hypothetical protein
MFCHEPVALFNNCEQSFWNAARKTVVLEAVVLMYFRRSLLNSDLVQLCTLSDSYYLMLK